MHYIHGEIGAPKVMQQSIDGEKHVKFSIEPLPAGYGTTLGNAYRRVLLSSYPGAAVTGIKIEGVPHEYTSITGVKDSVLDILLNLKQLRVKKLSAEPMFIHLKVKKEGIITAADIKANPDVEVINKDLYITTLDSNSVELDMAIRIEKGVGYKSIQEMKKENDDANLILVDASFSPVMRVKYEVVAARVGQRTDLDRLELDVETDGSVTAEETVRFSSNILTSYFSLFNTEGIMVEPDYVAKLDEILVKEREQKEKDLEKARETYTPIEILNLSPRTLNALINGGIGSIEQLTKCTESKLSNLRGFGKKAMTEVKDALKAKTLKLFGED